MAIKDEILKQIEAVLDKYRVLQSRSRYSDSDFSDLPQLDVTSVTTLMCDTIGRFSPSGSQYVEAMRGLLKEYGAGSSYVTLYIAGVLSALRDAYALNYLEGVAELIHADVFSDFVEMAEYLLSEGYKDPAAVIIGSVLEEHLRQLCVKTGVPTTIAGKAKKADQLNADLAGRSVYTKLDQKSVTSWLDLRNKAAHGKYNEYTKDQVALLIQGVQNFMTRIPA